MELKDLIRAEKVIVDEGEWKTGVKMPASKFPLSRARSFSVRASFRWRVAVFMIGGKEYRLLILWRPEFEKYISYFGRYDGRDMAVLARYEFHATHPGWHIHSCCSVDVESLESGGFKSMEDRIPSCDSYHRNKEFGISSDEKAYYVAAKKFGLIGRQLLEMQEWKSERKFAKPSVTH